MLFCSEFWELIGIHSTQRPTVHNSFIFRLYSISDYASRTISYFFYRKMLFNLWGKYIIISSVNGLFVFLVFCSRCRQLLCLYVCLLFDYFIICKCVCAFFFSSLLFDFSIFVCFPLLCVSDDCFRRIFHSGVLPLWNNPVNSD